MNKSYKGKLLKVTYNVTKYFRIDNKKGNYQTLDKDGNFKTPFVMIEEIAEDCSDSLNYTYELINKKDLPCDEEICESDEYIHKKGFEWSIVYMRYYPEERNFSNNFDFLGSSYARDMNEFLKEDYTKFYSLDEITKRVRYKFQENNPDCKIRIYKNWCFTYNKDNNLNGCYIIGKKSENDEVLKALHSKTLKIYQNLDKLKPESKFSYTILQILGTAFGIENAELEVFKEHKIHNISDMIKVQENLTFEQTKDEIISYWNSYVDGWGIKHKAIPLEDNYILVYDQKTPTDGRSPYYTFFFVIIIAYNIQDFKKFYSDFLKKYPLTKIYILNNDERN